ncbi:hypothetical protein [Variovorax gossypii]|uniref:hypothetical protein n=1 Tax=uncultured Variovorax sp. TaxID=114708 RepID=UPI00262E2993|nr:hypothetical protein [uncultured Variovorax sp.]
MNLEQVFRDVAHRADAAVTETMTAYSHGHYEDEDDITAALAGSLRAHISMQGGPVRWSGKVMRHRSGRAAEEKNTGADLLIHVALDTPALKYSKGVLVQAKRNEPGVSMSNGEHARLLAQCGKMLSITSAAYVFNFSKGKMRCGSATVVQGSSNDLIAALPLTPYRFFLDLFRCATGDQEITSHRYDDLKIPTAILIQGAVP